jgi:putative transposase
LRTSLDTRLTEGKAASSEELDELKAKIQDMQLEIDILKKTIDVLKKDPGVNKSPLNNREKAVIVDALKEKYPLPVLIKKLKLAKSSYYYQKKRVSFAKKHKDDYQAVATIFHNNKERYGYRRIKIVLNREGYTLSEKVIRQIMRENGLVVKGRKARKYCSYKGEISPEVPNVIRTSQNENQADSFHYYLQNKSYLHHYPFHHYIIHQIQILNDLHRYCLANFSANLQAYV